MSASRQLQGGAACDIDSAAIVVGIAASQVQRARIDVDDTARLVVERRRKAGAGGRRVEALAQLALIVEVADTDDVRVGERCVDVEQRTHPVVEHSRAAGQRVIDLESRKRSCIRCKAYRAIVVPDPAVAQRRLLRKSRHQRGRHPGLRRQRPRAGDCPIAPVEDSARAHRDRPGPRQCAAAHVQRCHRQGVVAQVQRAAAGPRQARQAAETGTVGEDQAAAVDGNRGQVLEARCGTRGHAAEGHAGNAARLGITAAQIAHRAVEQQVAGTQRVEGHGGRPADVVIAGQGIDRRGGQRLGKRDVAGAADVAADRARAAVELQCRVVGQGIVAGIGAAGVETQAAGVEVDRATRQVVERRRETGGCG